MRVAGPMDCENAMTFSFRPARRSEAKPLIGLYSESGAGKTFSALLLARGFAGDGKIGMVDTEAGRGEAYADLIEGGYAVLPLRDTFSPQAYGQAIATAEAANLRALIIDSASHEWSGVGGVLSQAADRKDAGDKGVLVWQRPKMDHSRHFMLRLMQTPIPLVIVCMRAKYPMQQVTNKKGEKEWVRSEVLEPDQASDILFEMFVHAWIDQEHRLRITKLTRPDLATVFLDKQPITLDTGRRLAAWAKGDQPNPTAHSQVTQAADHGATPPKGKAPASSAPRQNGTSHLPPDEVALSRDGWSDVEVQMDDALADAATKGTPALKAEWQVTHQVYRKKLQARLQAVHKPVAEKVDAQEAVAGHPF